MWCGRKQIISQHKVWLQKPQLKPDKKGLTKMHLTKSWGCLVFRIDGLDLDTNMFPVQFQECFSDPIWWRHESSPLSFPAVLFCFCLIRVCCGSNSGSNGFINKFRRICCVLQTQLHARSVCCERNGPGKLRRQPLTVRRKHWSRKTKHELQQLHSSYAGRHIPSPTTPFISPNLLESADQKGSFVCLINAPPKTCLSLQHMPPPPAFYWLHKNHRFKILTWLLSDWTLNHQNTDKRLLQHTFL